MNSDSLATITFIVLCHNSAARTLDLVTRLLDEDPTCRVIVHWDKKSSRNMFQQLADRLDNEPRCHLMRNRMRCGWGQWGLVEAPLRALEYALAQPKVTDYFYLVSEYCRPIRPLIELREYLTEHNGTDFIECEGPEWIKGGIREDRYLYRHYLDKRKHPKLHRWMYRAQKKLGLKRKPPKTFEVKFGSQWWCISKESIINGLEIYKWEVELKRLKTSWIPDECFFQSLIFHGSRSYCAFFSLTKSPYSSEKLERNDSKLLEKFFSRKFYEIDFDRCLL